VSYISTDAAVKEPRFGHAWRTAGGMVCAAVYLSQAGRAFVNFDSPVDARAVAAECIKAAEAMERLEAESTALPAEGEAGDG
jgi:hypothetical protein